MTPTLGSVQGFFGPHAQATLRFEKQKRAAIHPPIDEIESSDVEEREQGRTIARQRTTAPFFGTPTHTYVNEARPKKPNVGGFKPYNTLHQQPGLGTKRTRESDSSFRTAESSPKRQKMERRWEEHRAALNASTKPDPFVVSAFSQVQSNAAMLPNKMKRKRLAKQERRSLNEMSNKSPHQVILDNVEDMRDQPQVESVIEMQGVPRGPTPPRQAKLAICRPRDQSIIDKPDQARRRIVRGSTIESQERLVRHDSEVQQHEPAAQAQLLPPIDLADGFEDITPANVARDDQLKRTGRGSVLQKLQDKQRDRDDFTRRRPGRAVTSSPDELADDEHTITSRMQECIVSNAHDGARVATQMDNPVNDHIHNALRVPITLFGSLSYYRQEIMELVWVKDEELFEVHFEGKPQRCRGKDRMVTLSADDVDMVLFNTEPDGLVHMTGPKSSTSHGHIFIRFLCQDDFHATVDCLGRLKKQHIRPRNVSRLTIKSAWERERRKIGTGEERDESPMQHAEKPTRTQDIHDHARSVAKTVGKNHAEPLPRRPRLKDNMQAAVSRGPATGVSSAKNEESAATGVHMANLLRRSTRTTSAPSRSAKQAPSPAVERWTQLNKLEPWSQPVIYPCEGARRVTIEFQDLERLDEGEFLNDTLISFALRRIEESIEPEFKKNVHFFNSYFYTALTSDKGAKGFNYDAVKRWTKSIDLMSTDFIVVPINHALHWFLAIICNLPRLRQDASSPMLLDELETTKDRLVDLSLVDEAVPPQSATEKETESVGDRKRLSRGRKAPLLRKYDINTTAIITLDSLGHSRTTEIAVLKDYIIAEAQDKQQFEITRSDLQGITAKNLVEQTNFCDCGLFVIGYMEAFAKDPRKFIDRMLSRTLSPEADFADFDPSKKRAELREALLSLYAQQEEQRQRLKSRKVALKSTISKKDEAVVEPQAVSVVDNEPDTQDLEEEPPRPYSMVN